MATGTYSVRAAASIVRRGPGHVRRRASLVFGEEEIVISTDPNEVDATLVTEAQLDAILRDSNLCDGPETATPGLRVKDLAPEPEPEAAAEETTEAGHSETQHHHKRRGRRR